MSETPTRTGEFTQDRARRTYEALLEAATALFSERGFDSVGSPDIAERAGVSVGTFYRYFEDKKQIFLVVMDRSLSLAQDNILTGLDAQSFVSAKRRDAIAGAIHLAVAQVEAHSPLFRELMAMSLRDADVLKLRTTFERKTRDRLSTLLAVAAKTAAVRTPDHLAFFIQNLVVETVMAMVVRGDTPGTDREATLASLVAAVEHWLEPTA